MPASAQTLSRCLDLRHGVIGTMDRDSAWWATRADADREIRHNVHAEGMRAMRAFNTFSVFWIAAQPVHVNDIRVVLRYVREDLRGVGTACVDRPEGLPGLAAAVPALTAQLAAQLLGRQVVLCDTSGVELTVTPLAVDDAHVLYRHPVTGRMVSRHMSAFAVVRGAIHKIRYSAGSEVVNAGPPRYDFTGLAIESYGYFYSAWCSCGNFAFTDSSEQSRRAAVSNHLHEVGAQQPHHGAGRHS